MKPFIIKLIAVFLLIVLFLSCKKESTSEVGFPLDYPIDNIDTGLQQKLSSTTSNDFIEHFGLGIMFHKAGDTELLLNGNDRYPLIYTYCYKEYNVIFTIRNNLLNVNLGYKNVDKLYCINITPYQQREIIQKMLDLNIFKLDNPVRSTQFLDYNDPKCDNVYPNAKLYQYDWIAIDSKDVVFRDDTQKNKTAILEFIKWIEDKYQAELLQHPVTVFPYY